MGTIPETFPVLSRIVGWVRETTQRLRGPEMLNNLELEIFFLTGYRLKFVARAIRYKLEDLFYGKD